MPHPTNSTIGVSNIRTIVQPKYKITFILIASKSPNIFKLNTTIFGQMIYYTVVSVGLS